MGMAGASAASAQPNLRFIQDFKAEMRNQRSMFEQSVNAMGEFRAKSVVVADGIDVMTQKIQKGKMGLSEFTKELRSGGIDKLVRQQIANRRSVVMGWEKSGAGALDATLLTPDRDGIRVWDDLRTRAGAFNSVLGSVAQNTVNWGKNTQWAGRQITAGFTMPLMMAAGATGKLAYDLDKGLTQVVKVYGDAATQLTTSDEAIKRSVVGSAKAMAAEYGQSMQDSIEIASQLAATGKTGAELNASIAEVTRARILGEVDLQDAMKQTITLQSVWNMSSTELADAFNYMNSMENQTVLTMQDFAEGIPKVAGIIKSLNGDVQEAGTLLAALKAGGIDAAEGATAVKSIAFKVMAPTSAAVRQFTEETGRSYDEVMEGADGVLDRLRLFGEATKDIGMEERVGLIQRMFGLHQGSKALTIIEQLASGSEQMTRAFEVAGQSSEVWAETASRELEKLTGSDWQQFQQQLQILKIELAEMGKDVLQAATPVLKFFSELVGWLRDLPEGVKSVGKGLLLFFAALGPAMMMVGIGANALFSTISGISRLLEFVLKSGGLMSAEQAVAQRMAEQASQKSRERNALDEQSYARLAAQINQVTKALEYKIAMQAAETGNWALLEGFDPNPKKKYRDALGHFRSPRDVAKERIASGRARLKSGAAMEGAAMPGVVSDTAQAERNVRKMGVGAKVFGGLMAVSMLSTLAGSDTMIGKLGQMAMAASAIGMAFSYLPFTDTMMGKITDKAKALGTRFVTMGSGIQTLGRNLMGIAGPLTAVGALAVGSALMIRREIEEVKAAAEKAQKSTQTLAEVIGFSYGEASEAVDASGKKIQTLASKTVEFTKQNGEAIAYLNKLSKQYNSERTTSTQMVDGEMVSGVSRVRESALALALSEGVRAKLHGASAEQAEEAAKIVLKSMNQYLTTRDVEVLIKGKVDFDSVEDQLRILSDRTTMVMDAAMNETHLDVGWAESIKRSFLTDAGTVDWAAVISPMFMGIKKTAQMTWDKEGGPITESAKIALAASAEEMWALYQSASEEEQAKVLAAITEQINSGSIEMFEKLKKNHPDLFKEREWRNLSEVMNSFRIGDHLTSQEYEEASRVLQVTQAINGTLYELAGIDTSNILDLGDPAVLEYHLIGMRETETAYGNARQAKIEYEKEITREAMANRTLSDTQKTNIANYHLQRAGMQQVTHWSQAFADAQIRQADATAKANRELQSMSRLPKARPNEFMGRLGYDFSSADSPDIQRAIDDHKNIMTSAQSSLFNSADRAMSSALRDQEARISAYWESEAEALREGHERATDALAARQEAAEKQFDARRKAWQNKWETTMDNFQKRNEARRKATEDAYDGRIDKIKETIEVEQEAENTRQKIFQAEITRLNRLAQIANQNIDFNVALNTGDFDQAARIANDAMAQETSWRMEDSADSAGDAWDQRKKELDAEIQKLEGEKDAALDKIKAIEEAEKKALENKKQREDERLQAEQEALRKSFQQQQKALQRQQQAEQKSLQAREKQEAEARRRKEEAARLSLERELELIRARVPRTKQEMEAQIKAVDAAYTKYGQDLEIKGKVWAGAVGGELDHQIAVTNRKIMNSSDWVEMGKIITNNLLRGAMGIGATEFFNWLAGGPVPKNMKWTAPSNRIEKLSDGTYRAKGTDVKFRHSGGIIGRGGSRRTGISGNSLSQSEVPLVGLVGEAVLNRNATSLLGIDLIEKLNSGDPLVRNHIGGPDLAIGDMRTQAWPERNVISAFMGAMLMKGIEFGMNQAFMAHSIERSTQAGVVVGENSGVLYPGGWRRPASGPRTSPYGWRIHPITGSRRHHNGSDIGAPMGAPIYAAKGGTVASTGFSGGRGNLTLINHGGGVTTGYAHQSKFLVRPGQRVTTGQHIGAVGSTGNSTGPHLHFEYYVNGAHKNPNLIIPGMREGGYTMSDGLAMLHKKETVLTKPLSEKLHQGINQMADAPTTVNIDLRESQIYGVDDLHGIIENGVYKALDKQQTKRGRSRTIGNVSA